MARDNTAAVICLEAALQSAPILWAARSDPVDAADSGWQFTCGKSNHEQAQQAQIWAVAEIIDLEPALADFIDMPVGTQIERLAAGAPWKVLQRR